MAKEKRKKNTLKIRVFNENTATFIRYRRAKDRFIFEKAIVKPFYNLERLQKGVDDERYIDPGFPMPMLWEGSEVGLVEYFYRFSNVTFVDTNVNLITVRI